MAAGDSYELSEQAVKKLAEIARWFARAPRNQHPPRNRRVVSRGGGANGWITFTTASALLASDASQADCPVVLVWEGKDPGDITTVYNEQGFAADAGVDGYAKYSKPDDKWKIIIIPCPAGTS